MSIISQFRNFLKEPPIAEPMQDKEKIAKDYSHWRMRIFYSCFIGYTIFYLCKKNIAVALPGISSEFGYSMTELGILGSSLYLTYGIGKFVNGVLADGSDVRKFLPLALIMTALANIAFALTPSVINLFGFSQETSAMILLWALTFLWGVSGWFQSAGFPAVLKFRKRNKMVIMVLFSPNRYFLELYLSWSYRISFWMESCVFSTRCFSFNHCSLVI